MPSPLFPQDVVQYLWVLADMCAIDLVVRGHETLWKGISDGQLKWHEINLPQRPLGDDRVDQVPFMLLVVADKMLNGSDNALLLDTSDESGRA